VQHISAAQRATARPRYGRDAGFDGLELLARRAARGKIDRGKYLEKRSDILTSPVIPQIRL
jgi:hypothetical protein